MIKDCDYLRLLPPKPVLSYLVEENDVEWLLLLLAERELEGWELLPQLSNAEEALLDRCVWLFL